MINILLDMSKLYSKKLHNICIDQINGYWILHLIYEIKYFNKLRYHKVVKSELIFYTENEIYNHLYTLRFRPSTFHYKEKILKPYRLLLNVVDDGILHFIGYDNYHRTWYAWEDKFKINWKSIFPKLSEIPKCDDSFWISYFDDKIIIKENQ